MSKNLVLFAHPDNENSFNAGVLKKVKEFFKEDLDVLDLYRENFNPVLSYEELYEGKKDEKVINYQRKIKEANLLIIIHPLWWYNFPAILKGFIDRVFTYGFAYGEVNGKMQGLLTDKKVVIFTSLGESKEKCKTVCPCVSKTIKSVFEFCGMKVLEHKLFYAVDTVNDEQRKKMLEEVQTVLKKVLEA